MLERLGCFSDFDARLRPGVVSVHRCRRYKKLSFVTEARLSDERGVEVAAHHDAAKGRANLSSSIFARMTLPTKCPIFSDPSLQFKTSLNNSQHSNIPIYSTIF